MSLMLNLIIKSYTEYDYKECQIAKFEFLKT